MSKCIRTSEIEFFLKIILKKSKNICEIQKTPTFTVFFSTPFCVFQYSFHFLFGTPKKKYAWSEVFSPYWVVLIHTGLAK